MLFIAFYRHKRCVGQRRASLTLSKNAQNNLMVSELPSSNLLELVG